MIITPNIPLDLLFETERGLTLDGDRVTRWHPVKGKVFLEQPEVCAQPRLVLSGAQPVVRFDGHVNHLIFQGFHSPKGPHTFIFAIRPKGGILLDSQHGGPKVTVKKVPVDAHWRVFEVVQDTELPINGQTVLGSDYYGDSGFFEGDISTFGYKRGILQKGQREYLQKLFDKKFGENPCNEWIIRIKKPAWLKSIDSMRFTVFQIRK